MNQSRFSLKLRSEVERFRDGFRNPSAAFLIWYLVNFFRISEQDAKDAVCDNTGDKGARAIYRLVKKNKIMSIKEIQFSTDINYNTIRSAVINLTNKGLIERVGRGIYKIKQK